jgi:ribosomal protein S18 acetylase RimI-like enzyme
MSAVAKVSIPLANPSPRALPTEPNVTWSRLPWDSEQFGFSAARLEIGSLPAEYDRAREACMEGLALALRECNSEDIHHLTARIPAHQLGAIHAVEHFGFELLDGIQTFTLALNSAPQPPASPFAVRPFDPSDLESVLEIARTSFVHDRFHADRALAPEVADRVNEVWVANCCKGQMADAVFVAEDKGAVGGFVTCTIRKADSAGVIGMVAARVSSRRRGLARSITLESLVWFYSCGVRRVEVGTQLVNVAAARLYQSCGFQTGAVSLTFRKLL